VHTGLTIAEWASKLEGDFVECGVFHGFLTTSIMEYLNWNKMNKKFHLIDSFQGLSSKLITEQEMQLDRLNFSRNKYS
jgi:hypothetical protein